MTAADRCVGHVGGMAGEHDVCSEPAGDGHQLGRRVRPVLGDYLPRCKGPQAHDGQGGDTSPVALQDERRHGM